MKRIALCAPLIFGLTACNDDDVKTPASVVASSNIQDSDVHMDLYAQSKDAETEISVYLHVHNSRGYAQFLELTGSDTLSASYEGDASWSADFEAVRLPADHEPMLLYYQDSISGTQAGEEIDLSFLRDGGNLIDAFVTIVPETDFDVSFDSETLTPESTLQATWTEVAGIDYTLKFAFSCDTTNGNTAGFSVRIPNRTLQTLVSPFDLDINQFDPPPADASNCQVKVTLFSEEDQSETQNADPDVLYVESVRAQEVVLPITVN